MSERESFFLFITGLVLVMFGVGGVEQSLDDAGLMSGLAVSVVGLLIMWCGTLGLRHAR